MSRDLFGPITPHTLFRYYRCCSTDEGTWVLVIKKLLQNHRVYKCCSLVWSHLWVRREGSQWKHRVRGIIEKIFAASCSCLGRNYEMHWEQNREASRNLISVRKLLHNYVRINMFHNLMRWSLATLTCFSEAVVFSLVSKVKIKK